MAIAVDTALLTRLNSPAYNARWRVLIEDEGGVLRDYSDRWGVDWQDSAEWGATVDQRIPDFRIELKREAAGYSLAPLVANPANDLGRAIDKNRRVQIYAAAVDVGTVPASTDWKLVLEGFTEGVEWGGKYGNLQISGVERTGALARKIIRTERTYGSAAGVAAETVAQQIVDDNFGVGAWTIALPSGSPGFAVTDYTPFEVSVWEALETLGGHFGWVFGPRFISGEWRLALYKPVDVATATPVATIGPSQYLDVSTFGEDLSRVRNVVRITFRNRATGAPDFVEVTDAGSVGDYGEVYIGFTEADTSAIDTPTEATDMASAILRDLATAPTGAKIENLFWYPVEVGDVITWDANPELHTSAQTWAVEGYRHTLKGETARTAFDTSGKAIAHSGRWLTRGRGGPMEGFNANVQFELTVDSATGAVSVTPNSSDARAESFRFKVAAGDIQTDNFVEPAYDDALADEFSGTAWGERISTGISLAVGQAVYLVGYAYGVASATAADQQAAERSRRIRMWAPRGQTGPDAVPLLDEDAAALFLYPNRNKSAASVRWVVDLVDSPTLAEVQAGAATTSESIQVHTFDPAGGEQRVWVGVLPYANADGTGAEGPLRVRQYTYTPGVADEPALTWQAVPGSNPDKEAIQLIATDDSDQVAINFRTYAEGAATLPAYTRVPATGFATDPLMQTVEIDVPPAGSARHILEAYAVDGEGFTGNRLILQIDVGTTPGGAFDLRADALGKVFLTPNTQDTDAGSWRARVAISTTEAYPAVQFSDVLSDTVWEGAGSVWGTRVDTGLILQGEEEAYLAGYFFRTVEISTTAQQASRRSPEARAWTGSYDAEALTLKNFREIGRTTTEVTWAWDPGSAVQEVWIYDMEYGQPAPAEPWQVQREPDVILVAGTNQYTTTLPPEGRDKYVQFEARDRNLNAGEVRRVVLAGIPIDLPEITHISQAPGDTAGGTDVYATVVDPQSRAGTWYAWVNRGGRGDADPNLAAEATLGVAGPGTVGPADVWTLAGGGTVRLLDELPVSAASGKRIFFEYVTSDGASSGQRDFLLKNWSTVIDEATGGLLSEAVKRGNIALEAIGTYQLAPDSVARDRIVNGAISQAKVDAGFDLVGVETGASLPTTKTSEVIVWNGKVYRWNGTAYVSAVPAADVTGQIVAAQIADAAINTAKFAAGIEPVAIHTGTALPTTKSTNALYWNAKLYRWNGSAYVATVPTADLTGAIQAAQIADRAVSSVKIALGAVTADIVAAEAITTPKIALGAVTEALVAASAITTTKISDGAIQTPKIATGAITTATIAAGAVTAGTIAAGAVEATKIAAGAVITEKLAAGAVTAGTIASGAVTAAKIYAGAVLTEKLAAGAVTAAKIYSGTVEADRIQANNIAAGAIQTGHLAADSVTAGAIAAGAVTASEIAADAVRATHLYAGSVTAAAIATDAVRATHIYAGAVTASELAADAVAAGKIAAGAINAASLIVDGVITAAKLNIGTLSEISPGAGIITSGMLRNAAGDQYLNLSSTSTGTGSDAVFIGHPEFTLYANGNAAFSGEVTSAAFITGRIVVSGNLANGAVDSASVIVDGAVTARKINIAALSELTTDAGIIVYGKFKNAGDTVGVNISGAPTNSAGGEWSKYLNLSHTSYPFLRVKDGNGNDRLRVGHDGSVWLSGEIHAAAGTFGGRLDAASGSFSGSLSTGDIRIVKSTWSGTVEAIARFEIQTTSAFYVADLKYDSYSFIMTDDLVVQGSVRATSFVTTTPKPPKPDEQMTPGDWVGWGAGEAKRPRWPHEGTPSLYHPAIGGDPAKLAAARSTYEKDVSAMALGTARWADMVHSALAEASDFADFRARLGL